MIICVTIYILYMLARLRTTHGSWHEDELSICANFPYIYLHAQVHIRCDPQHYLQLQFNSTQRVFLLFFFVFHAHESSRSRVNFRLHDCMVVMFALPAETAHHFYLLKSPEWIICRHCCRSVSSYFMRSKIIKINVN